MDDPGRYVASALTGRLIGRIGLALAAGAIFGQASGANSRVVLALVPVAVGLFILGFVVERRGERDERASRASDP
jgi:hypothetical protein